MKMAKFRQNADLKKKLLQTDDAVLAECAVKDKIWGYFDIFEKWLKF